jgi:oligoribonuclease NrnB/cAMP/cGMP phosphodiesterase (DHH superfamily)
MKAYHICHHTDEDGIASAAVIYEYLKIVNKGNRKNIKFFFYKLDYTMDLNKVLPNNIPIEDEVYFVDYSFSKKQNIDFMINLANNGIKVIWIDHHKTSEGLIYGEILESKSIYNHANIEYFVDTNYCATYLAYKYAYLKLNSDYKVDYLIFAGSGELDYVPLYIKYVDSWDTWKHNMSYTTEFNYGMSTIKHGPTNLFSNIFRFNSENLNKLFSNDKKDHKIIESYMNKFVNTAIAKGKVIKEYKDFENDVFCDEHGFECVIADHTSTIGTRYYRCFAVNRRGNSTMFGDRVNKYDIVIGFHYNGKQYVYSLYTSKVDVDCEYLAKKLGSVSGLGGGGHTQAAGFQMYDRIIRDNSILHINNKLFNRNKYSISMTDDNIDKDIMYFHN